VRRKLNKIFWQILKISTIIAAYGFTSNRAIAQDLLEQESLNRPMSQITNVNQLRDISPTDWAYEALRSLVDRYGCISGFPNQTYRGNQPLSRYEFAAGLNSCLNQIERLIASSGSVAQEDVDIISRLSQEFEAELAATGARVDELESRTALLEDNQFSTTTVLNGEAVFALAQAFGDSVADNEGIPDDIDSADFDSELTFSDRIRLNFDSSFYGNDRLRIRLEAGNVPRFDTETNSTRLSFDASNGNNVVVTDVHYRFALNERITAFVGPKGLDLDDVFSVTNPILKSDSGGAITRFGRRNALLFFGTGGAGASATIEIIPDKISFTGVYLSDDAEDPSPGEGLFNGSFNAGAQLKVTPTESLELAATFLRNYQTGDSANQSGGTVSGRAAELFGDVDTAANKIGLGASYTFKEKFLFAAWGGYADVDQLEGGDASGNVWTWAANVSLLDLGKEGSILALGGGMPPKFISDDAVSTQIAQDEDLLEDEDTSYIAELFYLYPLNDNISITPGAYAVFNPDHSADNDTLYVGVIRTTFKF